MAAPVNATVVDDEPVFAITAFPMPASTVQFKKWYRPRYPIATISQTDFIRLTGPHGYPRLAYLRDGRVQAVWEYDEIPTREQLEEVLARTPQQEG